MPTRVTITYDGKERTVGAVHGNTLRCRRDEAKHLFRGGRGTVADAKRDGTASWGLDCKVCDGLFGRGVEWLEIETRTRTYRCKLSDMKEKGVVLNMGKHRAQYFLNLMDFEVKGEPDGQ